MFGIFGELASRVKERVCHCISPFRHYRKRPPYNS